MAGGAETSNIAASPAITWLAARAVIDDVMINTAAKPPE